MIFKRYFLKKYTIKKSSKIFFFHTSFNVYFNRQNINTILWLVAKIKTNKYIKVFLSFL